MTGFIPTASPYILCHTIADRWRPSEYASSPHSFHTQQSIITLVRLTLDYGGRKGELLVKFLTPLLPQGSWNNKKNAAPALGPPLCDHKARLDGLSQAYFIGEYNTFRKRRRQCKQGAST
jgi:hypothetical protein